MDVVTPSRTLAAAGVLVTALTVGGCSFSGSAQAPGGSASTTSPSPRAVPEKTDPPATPETPASPETPAMPAAPSAPAGTAPPGARSSPPSSGPAARPPAAKPPSSQAPGGQAPAAAQGSAASRCTADALDYEVPVPGKGSGGSASSTTSLVLRNTGSTTCTLYGYPGVSFVAGDDRHQAGAAADRQPGTTPTRVTLVPGAAALAPLTIAANASVGAPCQPTDVVGLVVYPPGSTDAVLVDRPATACGGPDAHQLVVGPVQAG